MCALLDISLKLYRLGLLILITNLLVSVVEARSPIDGETQPNIAGYGVGIFSCLERDRNNRSSYVCMSGTSMATPYVAGIAALCASADTKLQGEVLRQHLLNTALPSKHRRIGSEQDLRDSPKMGKEIQR